MSNTTHHDRITGGNRGVLIRGLRVSDLSFAETVAVLLDWAGRSDRLRYFACDNAYSAELACRDAAFRTAMAEADLLAADGAGIVVASWILGHPIRERSSGPELFKSLSAALDSQGDKSVFYLGTSAVTLEKIRRRHEREFPRLRIAGMLAPPYRDRFSDAEMAAMTDAVNAAAPHVLWVGLGAPKQECWIRANRDRLNVPLCCPVGAAFDYYAGNTRMPPIWMQRAGLHWLHRLAQNPRRLWRRNLVTPVFLANVLLDRLRGRVQGR